MAATGASLDTSLLREGGKHARKLNCGKTGARLGSVPSAGLLGLVDIQDRCCRGRCCLGGAVGGGAVGGVLPGDARARVRVHRGAGKPVPEFGSRRSCAMSW